jgi:hypothetical protein
MTRKGEAMATVQKGGNGVTTARALTATHEPADVYDEPKGLGWVMFSAIMLGFAGAWALFEGILAISRSKVFVANANYVFSDLRTWGWIMTFLGALAVLAAFTVFTGSQFARWFGVTAAGINAFGQLMFLHANPWWSMAMFAVDMLVIYGLAVYAGPKLRSD